MPAPSLCPQGCQLRSRAACSSAASSAAPAAMSCAAASRSVSLPACRNSDDLRAAKSELLFDLPAGVVAAGNPACCCRHARPGTVRRPRVRSSAECVCRLRSVLRSYELRIERGGELPDRHSLRGCRSATAEAQRQHQRCRQSRPGDRCPASQQRDEPALLPLRRQSSHFGASSAFRPESSCVK